MEECVLSITSKCNLKCKHCFVTGEGEPSFEELKKVIDDLKDIKVRNVGLFGGEPFLRKDIFEIIQYAKRHNFFLSLNTNGTLLTEKIVKKLVENGIKGICISLDGSKKEIVDSLRGKGVFEKTIEGIKNAVENGMNVLISCTITKINWQDLRNIIKLGKELRVNKVRFNHIFYSGYAIRNMESLYLSPSETKKILFEIKKLKNEFGDFITGSWIQAVEIIEKWEREPPDAEKFIIVEPCGAGIKRINIRPDFKVTPCEIMWDVIVGDIKKESLKEILNNSNKLKEFREKIILTRKYIGECLDCIYRYYCYTGHRCTPYYLPEGIKNKKLYCILENPPAFFPYFNLEKIK